MACIALAIPLGIGYATLSRQIDARLNGTANGRFQVYSAPQPIEAGDAATIASLVDHLRRAGYTTEPSNPMGSFQTTADHVIIQPGRQSFFQGIGVQVTIETGRIASLRTVPGGETIQEYALEPVPLVHVDSGTVESRRAVRLADIPLHLKHALLSIEDKRFFQHAGVDPMRAAKAVFVNVKNGRKEQGGSTLTMQLSRNLFLDGEKTWMRKGKELVIATMLEAKLSKEQILEHYVNQVYLGRRDTQELHGFGQAAETYFGKSLKALTLDEAALLAGMVQRPSYFDPSRHPERAVARRNLVLHLMARNGLITTSERMAASAAPLTLRERTAQSSDLPWFLDLAMEEARKRTTAPGGKLYTTLDPALQAAATDAVRSALPALDRLTEGKGGKRRAEISLVAIDSHTGEVKALVGGRDFGRNQVNHAISPRQPGSVFKPFVYAAALQSERRAFGPSTTLNDAPTTFRFDGQEYRPSNFGDHFYGYVSMRRALAKSMNVATVSLAEQVGYREVHKLARSSGFNETMRPTPALALGAYEATPLEVAGAYTVFANHGVRVAPAFVNEIRSQGRVAYRHKAEGSAVLDPAPAFLMQDMLAEVLQSGTAAGVRSQGFDAPAAGKTGTSRDGWFAGYVSNLICVVWVGFDDNSDLDIEGARSALPIWTAFMKKAGERAAYRQSLGDAPEGVAGIMVDAETGQPAGPECRRVRKEYFIRGKEPKSVCRHEAVVDEMESEFAQTAFLAKELNRD